MINQWKTLKQEQFQLLESQIQENLPLLIILIFSKNIDRVIDRVQNNYINIIKLSRNS